MNFWNFAEDEDRVRRRAQFVSGTNVPMDEAALDELDEDAREDMDDEVNLEAFDVPLREWLAQDRTRRAVQKRFKSFLNSYSSADEDRTSNRRIYVDRIRSMATQNSSSLEVSYLHLMEREVILAMWLADAPKDILDIFNEVATRVTLQWFPQYGNVTDEVHVRISHVPVSDSLRNLRKAHLGLLVKVSGVVTRRTGIFPQLKLAMYDCVKCKFLLGPFRIMGEETRNNFAPGSCPSCDSEGPFNINAAKSSYRNYQRVTLQETPGSIPPGRVPRVKEVKLMNDLIDRARPGEEIEVTGVYQHSYDFALTQKSGFPVFHTHIAANHILKQVCSILLFCSPGTNYKSCL